MTNWSVKFTAVRRSDGTPYERTFLVRARAQIEAEDAALRKGRMLGYRDFNVEATQCTAP